MVIAAFPPVDSADEDGLLAVGGDLAVPSLLLAYASGIFPWPIEGYPLTWFAPPLRAVLFLSELRISRSLRKAANRGGFECRIDDRCKDVIQACRSAVRKGRNRGTWITRQMAEAYSRLHDHGYCHSVGCFQGTELTGGLYGVSIGGMFAGESMFHREPNASKFALLALIDHVRERGGQWIDFQQMTPLAEAFGARLVPRGEFMVLLHEAIERPPLFP